MNFEALESFRVFSKTLNFTHAAELRHLTQPALHKQIRLLGETLEVDLYRRRGRSLELTKAGVTLAKFAREMSDRVEVLGEDLKEASPGAKVSLAAGRGSFLYLLGDAMREFSERFENRFQLLCKNSGDTLSAVRCGEAHLGVTVLQELPRDLNTVLLHEMTPRLIVAADHPLARKREVRTADLDGLPLICPTPPSPMREMIAGRLQAAGLEFNPVLDSDGWELLMHFASLGIGAAVVNGCCQPPQGTEAVRLVDFPKTRYYLVAHKQEYGFPELDYMRDCIIRNVSGIRLFD